MLGEIPDNRSDLGTCYKQTLLFIITRNSFSLLVLSRILSLLLLSICISASDSQRNDFHLWKYTELVQEKLKREFIKERFPERICPSAATRAEKRRRRGRTLV